MTNFVSRLVALLMAMFLLSACGEKSPQEVAEGFWNAVIDNDAKEVVACSTLSDSAEYDGFGREWSGFRASWGKIVIDGDNATVTTILTRTTDTGDESLTFDTQLLRQDEEWKVDYTRTRREVGGGPLSRLFGQIERVGKSISAQFGATAEQLSAEIGRTSEQLTQLSASLGEQATEIIEQQGEQLRKRIDELAESARHALKEQEKNLSDKERQALREVATDLDEHSEELSEPTLQSIADGAKSVAAANQKLAGIDNETLETYQKQWRDWSKQVEADLQKFVNEASARVKQE